MVMEIENSFLDFILSEIVKNCDSLIEQMLFYDLISRKNLKSYMESSLKEIEKCLDKSMIEYISSPECSKIKTIREQSEMEFKEWNESFGNQVKATIERQELLIKEQKKAKTKETADETEVSKIVPKKQNEWSDNFEALNNSNVGRKKRYRKKKGKNKVAKGGLIRWTEAESSSSKKDSSSKWESEPSNSQSAHLNNGAIIDYLTNFSKFLFLH